MTGITRKVLNWTDKKFDAIDENTKHPYLKAFGLGAVEGVIDGAVLMYPVLIGGLMLANHQLSKTIKKEEA